MTIIDLLEQNAKNAGGEVALVEFNPNLRSRKEDWKEFHKKLEKNLDSLRNDKSAKEFVNVLKKQITFFRENSDEYSYVFYIMKKC